MKDNIKDIELDYDTKKIVKYIIDHLNYTKNISESNFRNYFSNGKLILPSNIYNKFMDIAGVVNENGELDEIKLTELKNINNKNELGQQIKKNRNEQTLQSTFSPNEIIQLATEIYNTKVNDIKMVQVDAEKINVIKKLDNYLDEHIKNLTNLKIDLLKAKQNKRTVVEHIIDREITNVVNQINKIMGLAINAKLAIKLLGNKEKSFGNENVINYVEIKMLNNILKLIDEQNKKIVDQLNKKGKVKDEMNIILEEDKLVDSLEQIPGAKEKEMEKESDLWKDDSSLSSEEKQQIEGTIYESDQYKTVDEVVEDESLVKTMKKDAEETSLKGIETPIEEVETSINESETSKVVAQTPIEEVETPINESEVVQEEVETPINEQVDETEQKRMEELQNKANAYIEEIRNNQEPDKKEKKKRRPFLNISKTPPTQPYNKTALKKAIKGLAKVLNEMGYSKLEDDYVNKNMKDINPEIVKEVDDNVQALAKNNNNQENETEGLETLEKEKVAQQEQTLEKEKVVQQEQTLEKGQTPQQQSDSKTTNNSQINFDFIKLSEKSSKLVFNVIDRFEYAAMFSKEELQRYKQDENYVLPKNVYDKILEVTAVVDKDGKVTNNALGDLHDKSKHETFMQIKTNREKNRQEEEFYLYNTFGHQSVVDVATEFYRAKAARNNVEMIEVKGDKLSNIQDLDKQLNNYLDQIDTFKRDLYNLTRRKEFNDVDDDTKLLIKSRMSELGKMLTVAVNAKTILNLLANNEMKSGKKDVVDYLTDEKIADIKTLIADNSKFLQTMYEVVLDKDNVEKMQFVNNKEHLSERSKEEQPLVDELNKLYDLGGIEEQNPVNPTNVIDESQIGKGYQIGGKTPGNAKTPNIEESTNNIDGDGFGIATNIDDNTDEDDGDGDNDSDASGDGTGEGGNNGKEGGNPGSEKSIEQTDPLIKDEPIKTEDPENDKTEDEKLSPMEQEIGDNHQYHTKHYSLMQKTRNFVARHWALFLLIGAGLGLGIAIAAAPTLPALAVVVNSFNTMFPLFFGATGLVLGGTALAKIITFRQQRRANKARTRLMNRERRAKMEMSKFTDNVNKINDYIVKIKNAKLANSEKVPDLIKELQTLLDSSVNTVVDVNKQTIISKNDWKKKMGHSSTMADDNAINNKFLEKKKRRAKNSDKYAKLDTEGNIVEVKYMSALGIRVLKKKLDEIEETVGDKINIDKYREVLGKIKSMDSSEEAKITGVAAKARMFNGKTSEADVLHEINKMVDNRHENAYINIKNVDGIKTKDEVGTNKGYEGNNVSVNIVEVESKKKKQKANSSPSMGR